LSVNEALSAIVKARKANELSETSVISTSANTESTKSPKRGSIETRQAVDKCDEPVRITASHKSTTAGGGQEQSTHLGDDGASSVKRSASPIELPRVVLSAQPDSNPISSTASIAVSLTDLGQAPPSSSNLDTATAKDRFRASKSVSWSSLKMSEPNVLADASVKQCVAEFFPDTVDVAIESPSSKGGDIKSFQKSASEPASKTDSPLFGRKHSDKASLRRSGAMDGNPVSLLALHSDGSSNMDRGPIIGSAPANAYDSQLPDRIVEPAEVILSERASKIDAPVAQSNTCPTKTFLGLPATSLKPTAVLDHVKKLQQQQLTVEASIVTQATDRISDLRRQLIESRTVNARLRQFLCDREDQHRQQIDSLLTDLRVTKSLLSDQRRGEHHINHSNLHGLSPSTLQNDSHEVLERESISSSLIELRIEISRLKDVLNASRSHGSLPPHKPNDVDMRSTSTVNATPLTDFAPSADTSDLTTNPGTVSLEGLSDVAEYDLGANDRSMPVNAVAATSDFSSSVDVVLKDLVRCELCERRLSELSQAEMLVKSLQHALASLYTENAKLTANRQLHESTSDILGLDEAFISLSKLHSFSLVSMLHDCSRSFTTLNSILAAVVPFFSQKFHLFLLTLISYSSSLSTFFFCYVSCWLPFRYCKGDPSQ
jgi:hypothetical protein